MRRNRSSFLAMTLFLNFWPTDRIFQEDYVWETDVLKKVLAGCFRKFVSFLTKHKDTLCKKQSFQECVSTCAVHVRDCFKQKDLAKVSSCMKTRREDCIKKECELKGSLVPKHKKDHSTVKTTTLLSKYKT